MPDSDNDVRIDLLADSSGVRRGTAEAKAAITDLSNSLSGPSSALNDVANKTDKATESFSKMGAVIGAGVAAVAIGMFTLGKNTIDFADNLNDMSARTGIAVKDLASLKTISEQSGTSLNSVATGVQRLTISISAAQNGDKKYIESLANLGITAKAPKEALYQLADAVRASNDPTKHAADLQKVLSRNYAELIPLLKEGGSGLRKAAEANESFADSMARLAPDADKFNDNMAQLKTNTSAAAAALLNEMVPAMNAILENIEQARALSAKGFGFLDLLGLGVNPTQDAASQLKSVQEDISSITQTIERLQRNSGGLDGSIAPLENKLKRLIDLRNTLIAQEVGRIQAPHLATRADDQNASRSAAADAAALKAYEAAIKRSAAYLAALQSETAALSLNKDQQDAVRMAKEAMAAPTEKLRTQIMAAAQANLVERQRIDEAVDAEKRLAEQIDRLNDLYNARALAESDSIEVAEDLIAKYEEETAMIGLDNLAREEAIALRALEKDGINLTSAALDTYRQKLIAAVDRNYAAKEAAAAAKEAAAEWDRASQDISNSLTDALLRGFEGGADLAANFVDTLKNMFSSLVLRPIIQPIAQAGSSAVLGALGMGASGSASAGDLLGAGSSLMGLMAPGAISTQIGLYAGGLAEMAGATSALAGSIGTAVATVIPWVGAIAALGSMFGLFGGKPSNKAAFGSVDLATGSTFGLGNQTGKKQASQQTMDTRTALLSGIGGYSSILGRLGGTSAYKSIGVDVGERDGVQFSFDGGKLQGYGNDPSTALVKLFHELALGAEGLSDPLRTLLGYFEGTADEMATFANGLLVMTEYLQANPMQAAADAATEAGRSAWQTWVDQGATLRTALTAWDGSAQKSAELAELTQSRYQTELSLAMQIQSALESTHAMFASTIEEMKYSVLDQEGKYNFLRDQSAALEDALKAALDPSEIENLSKELNDVSRSAWQLLGEEERKVKLAEYETYLNEIDALTTERLNAAGATITAEHETSLSDSIAAAIDSAMQRVADQMMAAAQAQQKAADTPLHVTVEVDQPADVEVSYG